MHHAWNTSCGIDPRRGGLPRAGFGLLLGGIAAVQALGLLIGCSEDGGTQPEDGPTGPFAVNESLVVALDLSAGAAYRDSLTGLTLRFPEGATGVLTTGLLSEAPEPPWDAGRGLFVAYDGERPVQLLQPHAPGGCELLLGYGTPIGSEADPATERWFALPPIDTLRGEAADSLVFRLCAPRTAAGDAEAGPHYWLCEFPAGSDVAAELATSIAEAQALLATWRDSLAAIFAGVPEARTPELLAPRFLPDGDYYRGFYRPGDGTAIPAARIGLGSGATRGEIAHQIGHYLTHLLVGDAAYREIETHLPAAHGVGSVSETRAALGEDYAHYFAYLLTGAVEGAGDPDAPADFFPGTAPDPRAVDLPGVDGFGTLLLRVLERTDSTIVNLQGETVRVPVVGLTREAVVAELIAHGEAGIHALRDRIATHLATLGKQDCLAPLASAVGWNGAGWGQIVGRTWGPLEGAEVLAYVSVDGEDYFATADPILTDSLGWFHMPVLFPGPQMLRVVDAPDSQEFALEVPWEHATDFDVSLSKFFLWPDLRTLNGLQLSLHLTFELDAADTSTSAYFGVSGLMHCDGMEGIFVRNGIYVPNPVRFNEDDPEITWVLDTLDISYSLETGEVTDFLIRAQRDVGGLHTLEVRGIGTPQIRIEGARQIRLADLGPASPAEVQALYEVTLTGPAGDVYTDADLIGDGHYVVAKGLRR
ncbi:MAG: hypothetical protein GF330_09140 [Candidatus Eisenbacteria bacterium]|nr:hypothetical protein [Candidatus Eisenbacteria bacterium]